MIPSSDSADDLTVVEVVALLGVSRVCSASVGHADDGVQRRADLVAHVGEERALGSVASSARRLAISSSLTSCASRAA